MSCTVLRLHMQQPLRVDSSDVIMPLKGRMMALNSLSNLTKMCFSLVGDCALVIGWTGCHPPSTF